jgi:hypothetical protein
MKLTKTTAAASLAICGLAAGIAWVGFAPAMAQQAASATPAPAPPVPVSNVPRHVGTFSGGRIDQSTYVPSCPKFAIGMDAQAINESNSRAYVEAEARKFESLRERWDGYEDCLIENGRRDIELVRVALGNTLSSQAVAEGNAFNTLNAAATAAVPRIQELMKKAKRPAKNAPAAAAAAGITSTWTAPQGRHVGSLSAGPADAVVWSSGCPVYTFEVTEADFANATAANFNVLAEALRPMPERITAQRSCRQDNGQDDYDAVQKLINDGVNAVYGPAKGAFETEYNAIRFQLNQHRQAGGLLAPPDRARAPAKKAPAKKKK